MLQMNKIFKLKEKDNQIMLLAVALFLAIYFFFLPAFFTSIDEYGYLKNAVLLKENGSVIEKNVLYACNSLPSEKGFVTPFFIGRSLLLLPFTFFGLNAVMLSGLLIHLINFLLIVLILKKLNIQKTFAFIYLFYPVFLWESRTLYSELLVLTFLLAALYFFLSEKKKYWLFSGLMLGFAVMTRYDAVFAVVAFLVASFFSKEKKVKAIFLALGAIPIALLILAFNQAFYSNMFSTGYGSGIYLLAHLLNSKLFTIALSAIILLVFYPLLLASPFLSRKARQEKSIVILYALLAFFYIILNGSFTDYLDYGFSLPQFLSIRLRYLVPLAGMLIVPVIALYEEIYEKLKTKIKLKKEVIAVALLFVLVFAAIVFSFYHQELIYSRTATYAFLKEKLPVNAFVIGSSDDCMYFMQNFLLGQKYARVDLSTNFKPLYKDKDIYSFIENEQKTGNNVYVVDITYTYRLNRNTARQQLNERIKKRLLDFIEENNEKLELIEEQEKNNSLVKIYRWKE